MTYDRQTVKKVIATSNTVKLMEDHEVKALGYDWEKTWARPEQLPPMPPWIVWLILAGRGFGKTRTGAEWIRARVDSKQAGHIALVAPTAADARDVMVEGESGLLRVFPKMNRPHYEPSKRRITFHTGAVATVYSADEPERLRGPNHDTAWCDEICSWRYPEAYDMLLFGLRLGDPQCCITTTPKPIKLLKQIMASEGTVITRGSTYDNAENLAKPFLDTIIAKYSGTRLGRQEINAEILEDTPGALWTRAELDNHRQNKQPDEMDRIVVAVDPAITSNAETSDETGIVAAGAKGPDGFVLGDYSGIYKPAEWARKAVDAYYDHDADYIVAEDNQGGEMVSFTIHTVDPNVPVKLIHASRGKLPRAEPVSALYEQGRVHHIGSLGALEDQLTTWVPGETTDSPDRLDALVHAITALLVGKQPHRKVKPAGLTGISQWN